MNWYNLVAKNMLRNLRHYMAYILAATLAVMIFAMFTNFVDNPAVRDAPIADTARQLLIVFRVLVALFAVFFVFYFHSALIRTRNKEFGLFLTLGVTPRQIGRLIFYESLLIGLLALLIGIVLGIICAYFFQLAMQAILGLPETLPFVVSSSTFLITGIFFGIVFVFEAGWIMLSVMRRTPRVLLLGTRTQQEPPQASWRSVLLGLLCIGVAYDLALQFSSSIAFTMFPIVGLTIIGTYLLFSQCSVMLLNGLRQPGIPGLRLLLLSRLAHRMRDYARMLTVVTVLNAVVLTSMGAIYGGLHAFEVQTIHKVPFSLQLLSNAADPTTLTSTQVQQEIARQRYSLQAIAHTSFVRGSIVQKQHTIPVAILSFSSFVQQQEALRQAHPDFTGNKYNVQMPNSDSVGYIATPDEEYGFSFQQSQLVVGEKKVSLQLKMSETRVLNEWFGISHYDITTNVVVVTDALYAKLVTDAPAALHWQIHSYVLVDWQGSAPVVHALRQQLPNTQQMLLTDTVTHFTDGKQVLAVLLFAAFFIGCLFFLAAGSAIYLKLFTQQEEDRRQFHALQRIGFQRHEATHLLNREFMLLFFIPIALAIVHSVVALLDLANVMVERDHSGLFAKLGLTTITLQALVPIVLLYLVSFMVYCWIARVNYLRRMQLATA